MTQVMTVVILALISDSDKEDAKCHMLRASYHKEIRNWLLIFLSFFWFVLPDKQLSVVLETVNIVFIASTGHVK